MDATKSEDEDKREPSKVLSAGAVPFVPSYFLNKQEDNLVADKLTSSSKHAQLQNKKNIHRRNKASGYAANYYPNMPSPVQTNNSLPLPGMPGSSNNLTPCDQYLPIDYCPFIPISYQYPPNTISDNYLMNHRAYYPIPGNYNQKKKPFQCHSNPDVKHDTHEKDTKVQSNEKEVSQVNNDTNTVNTTSNRNNNNANQNEKKITPLAGNSADLLQETKKSKRKKKKKNTPANDKVLSTATASDNSHQEIPISNDKNQQTQDAISVQTLSSILDVVSMKTLNPSSLEQSEIEDFPQLKINSESNVNTSTVKSYSQVLRMPPSKQSDTKTIPQDNDNDINRKDLNSSSTSDNDHKDDSNQDQETKSKKKKKKKKKKANQGAKAIDRKTTFNIGEIISQSQQRQTTSNNKEKVKNTKKGITISIGISNPGIYVHKKNEDSQRSLLPSQSDKKVKPLNPLDSSASTIMHGKQRETPKKKKPSLLKRVILKERNDKKKSKDIRAHSLPNLYQDNNLIEIADETHQCLSSSTQHHPKVGTLFLTVTKYGSIDGLTEQSTKSDIHSRKFREYCDHVLSKEINNYIWDLLRELVRFQDRQYQKDPIKAKIRRRYVLGLREIQKYLRLKKLKCVVISPNLEKITYEGGIDHTLQRIIETCHFQNVPVVFGLNRHSLGRAVKRHVPVSIVGVVNYDGVHEKYHELMKLVKTAREDYKNLKVKKLLENITN